MSSILLISALGPQVSHGSTTPCTSVGLTFPSLRTTYSPPVTPPAVGEEFVLTTIVSNVCPAEENQQFVGIIEVRSSDGITQFLGWQSGILEQSTGRVELGLSWTPTFPDTYEARVFAISDFDKAEILSLVRSAEFEIVSAADTHNPTDSGFKPPTTKGKFLISSSGSAVLERSGKSTMNDTHYSLDFDISGDFVLNYTEGHGLYLNPNNVILSIKNEEEGEVLVVYGFNHELSYSADFKLLTYGATLEGYARGNMTGTLRFGSPIYSEITNDSVTRITAENSMIQTQVDGRVYSSTSPSLLGTLVLVPESQIRSVVVDKADGAYGSFLKRTITEISENSANPDIELDVNFVEISSNQTSGSPADSSTAVAFTARNTGNTTAALQVDRWIIEYGRGKNDYSSSKEFEVPGGQIEVLPFETLTIGELNLSGEYHTPAVPAGTYSVSLSGFKWYEKDFGAYKKTGNWDDYSLRAMLNLDYDIEPSDAGILYADNMLIRINDTSDEPFVAYDGFAKTVEIFVVNNGDDKISSLVHGDSVSVWPLNDRSLAEGYSSTADYFGDYECEYLEKGDKVRTGSIAISESSWPIGKNGIAQKTGSLLGLPGIYLLEASAYTRPCTLPNGEKVSAGSHSILAAFELR